MLPPLARSHDEAHLFMELHPCPCGVADFAPTSALTERDGVWVARYEGRCAECGRARAFEFRQPEHLAVPAEGSWADDDRPSELLDAGEWLFVADTYGSRPAERDDPDPVRRAQTRTDLLAARAALAEVLKFLPEGASEAPDGAFWTGRGRQVRAADPDRFSRLRLTAARDAYDRLLAPLAAPLAGTGWEAAEAGLAFLLGWLPDGARLDLYDVDGPLDVPLARVTADGGTVSASVSVAPARMPSALTVLGERGWQPPDDRHGGRWRTRERRGEHLSVAGDLTVVLRTAFGLGEPGRVGFELPAEHANPPFDGAGMRQVGIAYFVRLGPGDTPYRPGTVLRRVRVGGRRREDFVDRDELLGWDGTWQPSPMLAAAYAGRLPDRVVPADAALVERLVREPGTAGRAVRRSARRLAVAAGPVPRMRLARAVDTGHDDAGRPLTEQPRLDPRDRPAVVAYLRDAPVVLAAFGSGRDPFDPTGGAAVPLHLHTDGTWVWSESLAYFAARYGLAPEPDLMAHLVARGFRLPEVDEAALSRAEELLAAR